MRQDASKTPPFVLAVALAIVAIAAFLRIKDAVMARQPRLMELMVGDRTFTIEIADTAAKQSLGLGKRDVLSPERGMYFPFKEPHFLAFWMKDMRFPIDMVWIADGRVVDIDERVPVEPKGKPLPTYSPSVPADAVLELNAGMAEEAGIDIGDEVRLRLP
jgi:hypothetical protein